MTEINLFQMLIYFFTLLILSLPLGWYMAKIYEGKSHEISPLFNFFELKLYRFCGLQPYQDMSWKDYLSAMLVLNFCSILVVYAILRLQFYLPLNPQHFSAPSPELAFNTAVSFVTNTDWQAYSGEKSLSYFSQMSALTVQNFVSAATGMSLLIALIRSFVCHEEKGLGNFWVDTFRGILYILLPLSILLSILLVSQGVIQNFKPYQRISLLKPWTYHPPKTLDVPDKTITLEEQLLPMGPAASQVAIKQLGTNGGGFFNTNSAHPFENPTPLSNFLEAIAILLIPTSLCFTFGFMIKDKKQGLALLMTMFVIFVPLVFATLIAEQSGNPVLTQMGVDNSVRHNLYPGGNMEGKETRFGIYNSAFWAAATTATANGSVNAMHDSFTPLGGMVPLWLMHLNEVIFGGVGSGLYGMLMLVIITVFMAGLMVGRTPEYLGKKIEPYEMKMASFIVLLMPLFVLVSTAIACVIPEGLKSIGNPKAHGFTEILYTFTSLGNNNGSAFAGLDANTPFFTIWGGLVMLISRYWIAIPTLAIAGSLARKKHITESLGTLKTHTRLFITFLVIIIMMLGALSFLPALTLGPIVEHIQLWGKYGL